jgi:hypothetical protein
MGQRANYVIIRNGEATAFYDQWGAMGCIHQFAEGPAKAAQAISALQPTAELMDWAFAEGGYLIDFDEKRAIVFGYPAAVELDEFEDLGELQDAFAEGMARASALEDALTRSPADFLQAISSNWAGWMLDWDDRGVDAFAEHLGKRAIRSLATQPPGAPPDRPRSSLQA